MDKKVFNVLEKPKKGKWIVELDQVIQCKKCPKLFFSSKDFSNHKEVHLQQEEIKILPNNDDVKSVEPISTDRNKCQSCDRTFKTNSKVNEHKKMVHEMIKFNCDTCDKSFSSNGNLKQHKMKVHDLITHRCEVCEKSFMDRSSLMMHTKVQTKTALLVKRGIYSVTDLISEVWEGPL